MRIEPGLGKLTDQHGIDINLTSGNDATSTLLAVAESMKRTIRLAMQCRPPSGGAVREPPMSRMTFAERVDRFEAAPSVAVSGSDADQVLADMSARVAVNSFEQISLVVALGDTRGPDGSAALRAVFNAALSKYATVSRYQA